MSYRQAAKRIGISHGYLCELEHGRRSPSVIVANAIMDVYRIDDPDDRHVLVVAAVDDAGRNWEPGD
jgi:transcriptional regulator with XRE-family HTH domain